MYANIIMLGTLVKITSLVKPAAIEKAIEDSVPGNLKRGNIEAFKIGQELVSQT
jgi:Pyruvate/2-oxoacid:ferredoxin oxidoreductase gamma subunit